ncbi:hypothetical protein FO488_12630 [Geobacter sp. FeAm09]|uniref:hypothetical protein n=1 Tax=Geobacter sp. FeAm09 TaxID=2597769 RepID=UPI0011ECCDB9|nr:hypothetical protein [Geobacter sp. FeAm09]QEM68920.1 hypothetical protein FO488_12630 [Geobacter sp. FeAm09]
MKKSIFACIALATMATTDCATGSRDTIPAMVINNESFATIPVSTPILFIDNKKVNLPQEYKDHWPPDIPGVKIASEIPYTYSGFESHRPEYDFVTYPALQVAQVKDSGAVFAVRESFFTVQSTSGIGAVGDTVLVGGVITAAQFVPGVGSVVTSMLQGMGTTNSASVTNSSFDIKHALYDVLYPNGKKAVYHCGNVEVFDCRARLIEALKNRH